MVLNVTQQFWFVGFSRFIWVRTFHKMPNTRMVIDWVKEIIRDYGLRVSYILSDRASIFDSLEWRSFNVRRGARVVLASVFHPEGDGLVVRIIQSIVEKLRCICKGQDNIWLIELPRVIAILNNIPSMKTGFTAEQIVRGIVDPITVRERIKRQDSIMRDKVNKGRRESIMSVCDEVYIDDRNRYPNGPKKLEARFRGPNRIRNKISYSTFQLEMGGGHRGRRDTYNVKLLKKCIKRKFIV
jgi:hypothetical protein